MSEGAACIWRCEDQLERLREMVKALRERNDLAAEVRRLRQALALAGEAPTD